MGKSKMGDGDEKMGISGGGGKFQNPTTTKNPTTSEDADHVLFLSQQAGLEHVARLISCCSKTSAPAMHSYFSVVFILPTFSPTYPLTS